MNHKPEVEIRFGDVLENVVATREEDPMRWIIRWTDFRTFRDHEAIVHADSREAAEAIAGERKMTVTYLGPADHGAEGSRGSLSCLSEPVGTLQVVSLVSCGIATIGILLQAAGMLSSRIWLPF
jgi:hypothetical protein